MPRIRLSDFTGGLVLTPDEDQAPANSLRRALNVAPLVGGPLRGANPSTAVATTNATTVRSISRIGDTFYAFGDVAAVREVVRQGSPWTTVPRPSGVAFTGADAVDFVTGVPTPESSLPVGDYLFICPNRDPGGGNDHLVKVNEAGIMSRWGILPPTAAVLNAISAAKNAQLEKYINTVATDPLESAGDWTLTSSGSSKSTESTIVIDGNSIQLDVIKDDQAILDRTFGSAIDLTDFSGTESPDEDFITLFLHISRPNHIENIEVAFGTTAAPAGPFDTDFFSREITFRLVKRRKRSKLIALGDLVDIDEQQDFLTERRSRLKDLSFIEEWGRQEIPVTKQTWSRITLPKASFEEAGAPDWSLVRAIRITVTTNKSGPATVYLDRMTLNGSIGMIGDYKYAFTYRNSVTGTRSNPLIDNSGVIQTVNIDEVERQSVQLTGLPGTAPDPQVDELEIWRTVGNGDRFFLVDQISIVSTFYKDEVADYPGLDSGTNVQFLDASQELPLDNDSPNDSDFSFVAAAGPHHGRMWWLDGEDGNVYYSPQGRLEAVQAFVRVTSGQTDRPRKLIAWNDRLFALAVSGMYEIVGADEPFTVQRIEGAPGVAQTATLSTERTVAANVDGVFWDSTDGVYRFDGQVARNISDTSLLPVLRQRRAIENFAGSASSYPVRAIAALNAYWLIPSVDPMMIADFATGAWRTRSAPSALCDPYFDAVGGRILVADDASPGNIIDLEPSEFDTGGTAYTFDIKTAATSAGQGVIATCRKIFVDFDNQTEAVFTVELFVDGVSAFTSAATPVLAGRQKIEYNTNKQGYFFAVRVTGTSINNPVEVHGIELDIYAPGCNESR